MDERTALARLQNRPLNFDPAILGDASLGWRHDELRRALPPEPPGDPVPGGPWERAREVLVHYRAADPAMVRATYDADSPLEGRTMLLTIRFLVLRFRTGVRIRHVYDGAREASGRSARVYGWSYRTLEGHFEQGEMAYEVLKWLDTGEVEARIAATSKAADSGPWVLRLGFRLIGRRQQLRFYHRSLERVASLAGADQPLTRARWPRRRGPAAASGAPPRRPSRRP